MADEKLFEGTIVCQASSFRNGDFILLKKRPCKIVDMKTSKTGKHGGAKIKFTGIDIFTSKKYEEISQSTHNMLKVIVKKTDYIIIGIDDPGEVQLLTEENKEGPYIKLDPDQFNWDSQGEPPVDYKIYNAFNKLEDNQELYLSIISAIGEQQIHSYKIVSKKN